MAGSVNIRDPVRAQAPELLTPVPRRGGGKLGPRGPYREVRGRGKSLKRQRAAWEGGGGGATLEAGMVGHAPWRARAFRRQRL